MTNFLTKLAFVAAFAGLFAVTASALEDTLPMRSVSEETLPFQGGESLVYRAHYRWAGINADVARGYLTIDDTTVSGMPAYSCRLYGVTAKFYDKIFKVREDFRTTLRASDLRPLYYSRQAQEGGYYATDHYQYLWDASVIKACTDSKTKGERNLELPLDGTTLDFLSELYHLRNVDLGLIVQGKLYAYSLPLGSKVTRTMVIYKGREVKYVKGIGDVRTLKFALQLMDNEQFNDGTEMALWLSDDDNRVIVALETPIKVGRVRARLESYEGLKYPFTALIGR